MLLPETLALHDKEKFEFHYIYFLPWKDQMVASLRQAGGKVSCFSARNNIQILLRFRQVIRYVKENNIQLIHAHLPWAGFLSRIVKRFLNIPVLYTEHNKQERYHSLTYRLNKLTFNWQTQAIAVSDDVRESIIRNIKPRVPVQTILNGVNTDTFQRNEEAGRHIRQTYGIPEDALVIGTVAVFRFQKRLLEWLEIMKKVCDDDPRVFGILVGDGPLKNDIVMKRKELELESRVIMPGLIEEVRPWMAAMDIFMMTSVFEGLPIALLEAMSMECCIVSTDAGGIKEVVRNEEDGMVVGVDDLDSLPAKIRALAAPEKRRYLGKKARQRVIDRFSLKQMVQQLEEVYSGLVK